ncbi:MAG: tetratricopeptide repeat protein [Methanobrevibacter sp.]|uniref:tetratricopeptide repeat protein n=1 Tax=Methanobrevibacter sp. TaxID=66852 RepID=UPI001B4088FC|nr:tetratricopeptide repeat protein [Methanobrevibacter sp.]MBP3790564.1 tetratricopeptide repeat protein [Methanobrevibacter sp.]
MDEYGEWHVGDPIGFGNDVGSPEVPYMGYGPKKREEKDYGASPEEIERNRKDNTSRTLRNEAERLYDAGRYSEALTLINVAIENVSTNANNWNIKGNILDHLGNYEEAIPCYDKALELNSDDVIKHNKAATLVSNAYRLFLLGDIDGSCLNLGEAFKIFDGIDDKRCLDQAWDLRAQIFIRNGDYGKAFECYKHALEAVKNDEKLRSEYMQKRDGLLKYLDNEDGTTCPKCGNLVPITDNFCIRCGARVKHEYKNKKSESRSLYSDGVTIINFDDDI